mgnify:CR=1 FL=1|jgi:hypothetical protein
MNTALQPIHSVQSRILRNSDPGGSLIIKWTHVITGHVAPAWLGINKHASTRFLLSYMRPHIISHIVSTSARSLYTPRPLLGFRLQSIKSRHIHLPSRALFDSTLPTMSDSESSQDFLLDNDSDSDGYVQPAKVTKAKKPAAAKKTPTDNNKPSKAAKVTKVKLLVAKACPS